MNNVKQNRTYLHIINKHGRNDTLKKAAIHTLGCRVNQYESEAIGEMMVRAGYELVPFSEFADCYIINTCTVTGMSDKKSRQIIRRAKHVNPNAVVVVTGCYAQTAPDEIQKIDGVNIIVGTNDRKKIPQLVENARNKTVCTVGNIMDVREFEELDVETYFERTRAFLKIQDGCNQFCSYCIIPYARGRVRSRKKDNVISEVKRLAENGYREFVLSGIHVASYGMDLGDTNLLDIIKSIHKIDGVERIRIGSVEPSIITDEFVSELAKIPEFCPHFHISLQSGCDKTLKAMNRRYSADEYMKSVEAVRKNLDNPAISTDVMVGFSGETEEDFIKSCEFVEKVGFSKLHVFPYSVRRGTRAENFEGAVSPEEKDRRCAEMIKIGSRMTEKFLESQVGLCTDVLFERPCGGGLYEGFTKNYVKVVKKSDTDISGKILNIHAAAVDGEHLSAE